MPSSLRSPAKIIAQRETKKLEHSRSSTDLRTITEATDAQTNQKAIPSSSNDKSEDKTKRKGPRPSLERRRRSTTEWSGASPLARQRKLEEIADGRLADTFFSLHVADVDGILHPQLQEMRTHSLS